ncbi:MAG: glycosyltransferase family 2 protein [Clostridiales bacterium]|nr:glycosyltransferase family 2 protein [Clostridiales bacterium]
MITVVIPNYNGKGYLRECIDSVRQQTTVKYELIIVDNASTDGDYEWEKDQKDIIWIQLEQNYGFSKAVNEGIKKARGKYILLLNNDTVLKPNFLEEIQKEIEKDDNIFAVSSKMICYNNPTIIDDAGDEYNLLGWAFKRGEGKSIEKYITPRYVFSACAGAALYRKSIFKQIGGFDETFFAYMEDVDIAYRARLYGYKNSYCPTAEVYHIGSATSGSKHNSFKVKLAARNNIYMVYKNMPTIQLVINSVFLFMGYLIKGIYFKKKGLGRDYIQGIKEGIQGCKNIHKISFQNKNLPHYIVIQWLLIKNVWVYVSEIIRS